MFSIEGPENPRDGVPSAPLVLAGDLQPKLTHLVAIAGKPLPSG